jgi:hypothetical protein
MRNTVSAGVSGIEVISIQGDWTIVGKKEEQNGRFVISEVFVKPTKKLPPGGLSATVWRNLKVNDLINKIEKLSEKTDALQKEIVTMHESILKFLELENTQVLLDFVINNWDRRGRQKQPEKVYAYLSALYILFNFLDRKKPLTFLSEQLSLPKRTLISRINTCYELGYLERGKKYGYTVGKFALRWTSKTSVVLESENFPVINYLSKIFQKNIGKAGINL